MPRLNLKFFERTRRSTTSSEIQDTHDTTAGAPTLHPLVSYAATSPAGPIQVAFTQSASSSTVNLSASMTGPIARRRTRISTTTVKDTLVLSLEALAQSSDAFPPLKSAVGGLLFFVAQAEVSMHSAIPSLGFSAPGAAPVE